MNLEGIRNPECIDCELHKSCRTICLMGEGNPSAEIMLIGEAPGENEDRINRPFVGEAGQLLNNILKEFGINRSEVYITNVVKCRPPNNRTPGLKELDACKQYLVQEIRAIKPKVIIALGGSAMRSLLNIRKNFAVGSNRGATFFIGKSKIPVVPTYHPAYIRRNEEAAAPTMKDFERAIDIAKNGFKQPVGCHYYLGVAKPSDEEELVIDLETTGLDPFDKDGKILCIGTTSKAREGFVEENPEEVMKYLSNPNVLKIGHNIKFDYKWLKLKGYPFEGKFYDTMIAEHMLDENCPAFGLKEITMVHTDMGRYAEPFEKIYELCGKDMRKIPRKVLLNYCGKDVDATKRAYDRQLPQLIDQGLVPLFELTMAGERVIADAEIFGVNINQEYCTKLSNKYRQEIEKVHSQLVQASGIEDFNPRSTQQLAELLIDKLGLPIIKMTKKKKIGMDKFVLESYEKYDKTGIVSDILWFRKLAGDYAKYLDPENPPFLSDGKMHANFKIHGTDTGRYSCYDPNLMAITKKSAIRKIFISSFKGGKLGQVDYGQGELRILAQESQDKNLLAAFNSGVDIHNLTWHEIFGTPIDEVTEDQRFYAKTINFGIMYGMGVEKLAATIGKSVNVASKYMRMYKEKYEGVMYYINQKEDEIERYGEVVSLFGRRRRITIIDQSDFHAVSKAKRKAVNAPIQGGLHDLNILSMVAVARQLKKEGFRSKTLMTIHDAVVYDIYPGEEVELEKLVNEVFCNPDTFAFGFKFNVPLTITFKSGSNWKEIS